MIQTIKDWLIERKREVALGILLFLVATTSFGLGYLTNREFNHAPIVIEKRSG